ncbi:hypothetical protein DQP55_13520 [Mycolicibacterium sp. GF69]|nr:hypothetical protein DQP55_13520 [Mycolicibacterium sp. GF69]
MDFARILSETVVSANDSIVAETFNDVAAVIATTAWLQRHRHTDLGIRAEDCGDRGPGQVLDVLNPDGNEVPLVQELGTY